MSSPSEDRARLPKLCGADVELGNFIQGLNRPGGTAYEASRALLREIHGIRAASFGPTHTCRCEECTRASRWTDVAGPSAGGARVVVANHHAAANRDDQGSAWFSQDWGRRFLPGNGGCCYIDLNHLEICLPEVRSAWDHVAAWHAMLRIVRAAMEAANRQLPGDQRLRVLVNNSDGEGHSYGSHLNFLLTRECWDEMFRQKLQHQLFLAAFQVSSIVYTGQGKVGSENGAPPVRYQLSQRADFFEQLTGLQTTFARPIVNSRDEPLCGGRAAGDRPARGPDPAAEMARLHVIFFDANLCEVAALLKVGVMQIILAMIEAGSVDLTLALESPLRALHQWSHDPLLAARAATWGGQNLTAVELQLRFHEAAQRFVARGGCDGLVPRAEEILTLWGDTLEKLQARDWNSLLGRLDWVMKRFLIEAALDRRDGLTWDSPTVRHLDQLYGSLDEEEGLFWSCHRRDAVVRVVDEETIERFRREPPPDTRAWTRAMLLRHAGHAVEDMDWDSMRFLLDGGYWYRHRTLEMSDPLAFTEASARGADFSRLTIEEVLDLLESGRGPTQLGAGAVPAGETKEDPHERA
jgi:Pup amidohydrolase